MTLTELKQEAQALANLTGESYSLTDGYDERDNYTFVPVPTASLTEYDFDFFTANPQS